MSAPTPAERALLYQALTAQIGILVRTNDVEKALARLRAARVEEALGDPEIGKLGFRRNPWEPDSEFYIVKGVGISSVSSPPSTAGTDDLELAKLV